MKIKKIYLILVVILVLVNVFNTEIFASTNTYERNEKNLGIHSSITLTQAVKQAALLTPKVDATEKVYDFAGLFTEEEEIDLYVRIKNYIDKYDMDMAIVTIKDNNKSSARAYADDFYDYNDFGIGTSFDGILFLIDMDNRKMWISTTGKAINKYSDNDIDMILDSTYKYISNDEYYLCAKEFIIEASGGHFPILAILIFSLISSTVFVLIASQKHKTIKKATKANEYLDVDSFELTENEDKFENTHTSRMYIPPSSSSSSGGSSSHRSSSGRSHGGGGRSF